MKHSHYTTPRTMRDGQWSYGATSEPYRQQNAVLHGIGYMVVNIVAALGFIFVIGLLIWENVK